MPPGGNMLNIFVDGGGVEGDEALRRCAAGRHTLRGSRECDTRWASLEYWTGKIFLPLTGNTHFEQGPQNGQVGGLAAGAVGGGSHN